MCHFVLFLPVFGLGLFWIWPPGAALPVYSVIFFMSGVVYYALIRSTREPVKTGARGLVSEVGEVIGNRNAHLLIRVHGEIWKGISHTSLPLGTRAKIRSVEGTTLRVVPERMVPPDAY